MPLDARSAAQLIVAEVSGSSHATKELSAVGVPLADFCSIWKTAKPVLTGLAGIAFFIPGFGQTAAAALTALIKIGDQIATEMGCK